MSLQRRQKEDDNSALLQAGETSNRRTLIFAKFFIFLDVCLLPSLTIMIIAFSAASQVVPSEHATHPTNGYLCKCCDTWTSDQFYCCSCTHTADDGEYGGNSYAALWPFYVALFSGIFGFMNVFLAVFSWVTFVCMYCVWGKECRASSAKALSIDGCKWEKGTIFLVFGCRLLLLIAVIILYFTKPDVQCSCREEATYPMQYGQSYRDLKATEYLLLVHMVFNLVFLVSRRVLVGLLKDVEITEEMVWFRLCYVRVPDE